MALNCSSPHCFCAISCTHCTKGNLKIREPVDFWNFLISHRTRVPSLKCFFFYGAQWFWASPPILLLHLPLISPFLPLLLFLFLSSLQHPLLPSHLCIAYVTYIVDVPDYSNHYDLSHCTICFLQFKLNTCQRFSIIKFI